MDTSEKFNRFTQEVCEALKELHPDNMKIVEVEQSLDEIPGATRVRAEFMAHTDYGSFKISVDKYGPIDFKEPEKPERKARKKKAKGENFVNIMDELKKL